MPRAKEERDRVKFASLSCSFLNPRQFVVKVNSAGNFSPNLSACFASMLFARYIGGDPQ